MHGYCATVNKYDTLIPREIRAEAEETFEHRSYNSTPNGSTLTNDITLCAPGKKKGKMEA
jgi:hypothetical protein